MKFQNWFDLFVSFDWFVFLLDIILEFENLNRYKKKSFPDL